MSVWFCCSCKFGPFDPSLYVSCINCSKPRCVSCPQENTKTFDSLNVQSHSHDCHETSPYPTAVSLHTPLRRPSFDSPSMLPAGLTDLPGVRPIGRIGLSVPPPIMSSNSQQLLQTYSHTYMYICCKCQDGPKVYNVQPCCVVCNHQACDCCVYVK